MKRSHLLPLLALIGVAIAVATVIHTNRPVPIQQPVVQPSQSPYPFAVAGAGIIEAGRGNIAIGTAVFGVVRDIYVKVGDLVNANDPLFKIDDRDLQAQLVTVRAKVKEAQASLEKPTHRFDTASHLQQLYGGAIARQQVNDLRDDVEAAKSVLVSANAQLAQVAVEIERRVVRAPNAGRVLQINTRVGEYAGATGPGSPLMLLGNDAKVYLRVDIDESDAWRIQPQAEAVAFVRGNPEIKIPLHFEYIEPYVIPKTSLTGQITERTDIRVLQVIYSFDRGAQSIYFGQQMDVFIQAAAQR